ncbi:unnamed protein product [Darwinula stevensoni]|uniref:Protein adenylyltransferase Fic n=1 Tax=Darwinula stevensoni TaxID=69355 RepID=A0A7R8X8K9_9CRUS|nr:unnamed protein product [Darwinula stevensoni]CAG0890240.1 unnamed protein product [Darwinula stevensoni]
MLLRRSLAQCNKEGYESHATNAVSLFLVFSCGLLSSLVLVSLFGGNFLPTKEQLTARLDHSFESVPHFDEALVQVVTESYPYEYQERSRKTGDEVINRSQNRALQTPFHLGFNLELDDEPIDSEKKQRFSSVPTTELIRLEKHKSSKVSTENKAEAQASLHAALDMWERRKLEKAMKLFQHAMLLDPKEPDILTRYGEFLEEYEYDIIGADHLYAKALHSSPSHSKALQNRERTLPLVDELDKSRLLKLDRLRDELMRISDANHALRRIKKEAYFHYIYHTAGIEGNTMTLAQTRSILETRMAVPGKSILEHNEILGLDAALKFINQTLLHRIGQVTLHDILQIHQKVMGYADPDQCGQIRTTQVYVGSHIPPAAYEVREMLQDMVDWLNSEDALRLHPVEYASLAHYKLVYIHPFYDGNGRTARLLMNWFLMQSGYPPVMIRKQERMRYYETLENANEGDVRPFIRFIAECTEQTLNVYLWATREASGEILGSALEKDNGRTIIMGG